MFRQLSESTASRIGTLALTAAAFTPFLGCRTETGPLLPSAPDPVYSVRLDHESISPTDRTENERASTTELSSKLRETVFLITKYVQNVPVLNKPEYYYSNKVSIPNRELSNELVTTVENSQRLVLQEILSDSENVGLLVNLNGQLEKVRGIVGSERKLGDMHSSHGLASNSNLAEILEAKGELEAALVYFENATR